MRDRLKRGPHLRMKTPNLMWLLVFFFRQLYLLVRHINVGTKFIVFS